MGATSYMVEPARGADMTGGRVWVYSTDLGQWLTRLDVDGAPWIIAHTHRPAPTRMDTDTATGRVETEGNPA
jgi:hypothetical protein